MSIPTPAILKKQLASKRAVETTPRVETSSPASSETTVNIHPNPSGRKTNSAMKQASPKKPFKRAEHLTAKPLRDNPDLQKLQEEFKEMEDINRQAGWYDRNRNGKQTESKIARAESIDKIVKHLRDAVGTNDLVDVGRGLEQFLKISAVKKSEAIKILEAEGYKRFYIQVETKVPDETIGTRNLKTTYAVLAAPGTTFREVYIRRAEIKRVPPTPRQNRTPRAKKKENN